MWGRRAGGLFVRSQRARLASRAAAAAAAAPAAAYNSHRGEGLYDAGFEGGRGWFNVPRAKKQKAQAEAKTAQTAAKAARKKICRQNKRKAKAIVVRAPPPPRVAPCLSCLPASAGFASRALQI